MEVNGGERQTEKQSSLSPHTSLFYCYPFPTNLDQNVGMGWVDYLSLPPSHP